jgi:hypothetical protein
VVEAIGQSLRGRALTQAHAARLPSSSSRCHTTSRRSACRGPAGKLARLGAAPFRARCRRSPSHYAAAVVDTSCPCRVCRTAWQSAAAGERLRERGHAAQNAPRRNRVEDGTQCRSCDTRAGPQRSRSSAAAPQDQAAPSRPVAQRCTPAWCRRSRQGVRARRRADAVALLHESRTRSARNELGTGEDVRRHGPQ